MEEVDFEFYLTLINLNVNSYMCLVATTLDSMSLE